jgi:hypothetical protein
VKNNGVDVTLQSPYFPGTAWQQVQRVIQAANCAAAYDDVSKTLTIWPKTGGSPTGNAVVFSPETGMIGYPEFEQNRIRVRTVFAPGVRGAGSIGQRYPRFLRRFGLSLIAATIFSRIAGSAHRSLLADPTLSRAAASRVFAASLIFARLAGL